MKTIYSLSIVLLMLAGCTTSSVYVDISHERYSPGFVKENYSAYKDKKIFISSFTNNANNTSVFYYFSPDNEIKYGQYAIASYYWYCFEKAFNNIGMIVYKDNAPSNIPEFLFAFDYLTDQKIDFRVTVNKRGKEVYHKRSTVTVPAPETKNTEYLEKRAYEMVDDLITNIINDQDFIAAL